MRVPITLTLATLILLPAPSDLDWRIEAEQPGRITISGGELDIDVPAGVTLWFRRKLTAPVAITYEAMVISAGGANDRVSDLNCFWMVQNPLPARDGSFASYNNMRGYYVGLGGNGNTTTRFRRYIGGTEQPPLLLETPGERIVPNIWQPIRVLADGNTVEYWRDSRRIFRYEDPQPFKAGWFALRTTKNHMKVRKFRTEKLHAPQSVHAGSGA